MNDETRQKRLTRAQTIAFGSGAGALAGSAIAGFFKPQPFFQAYLYGYLFWLGLGLGCLGVAMMHHLTGGRWGFVVRRILEAGMMTVPWMAILVLPLFLGLDRLYPWAQPATVAEHPVLQEKAAYLNTPGFVGRTLFFLALWTGLILLLGRWSFQQDRQSSPEPTRKLRTLSGPACVVYPLTATFAYVDWIMSLEVEWHSTIFVLIILSGQLLSAIALAIVMLAALKDYPPLDRVIQRLHFHHLGNLLLTFVIFWTYLCFGQLLIIWSGNLPHSISWYLHRISGGWQWMVLPIFVLHFFLPFLLLLFRINKQRIRNLVSIACLTLLAHAAYLFWTVAPSFRSQSLQIHWLDPLAFIGIGGVWTGLFLARLKKAPLIPANDPRESF